MKIKRKDQGLCVLFDTAEVPAEIQDGYQGPNQRRSHGSVPREDVTAKGSIQYVVIGQIAVRCALTQMVQGMKIGATSKRQIGRGMTGVEGSCIGQVDLLHQQVRGKDGQRRETEAEWIGMDPTRMTSADQSKVRHLQ